MSIDEIIARAKEENGVLKFKALEGQDVTSDIIFEVVDAYFGFLTYPKLEDGFFTVGQLKQLSSEPLQFEIVPDDIDIDEAKEWIRVYAKPRGRLTVSNIQRRFRVGYGTARKLFDQLIDEGFLETKEDGTTYLKEEN